MHLDWADSYTYDEAGRLGQWQLTVTDLDPNIGPDLSTSASDAMNLNDGGNRTAGQTSSTGNRLLEAGGKQFVYDSEGNLVRRWTGTGSQPETRYVWDHRNRLIEVGEYANASFHSATLTNANFAGADVRGANFDKGFTHTATGLTATQLYSTSSYQAGDLTGIVLSRNNLSGWDFSGQNLTNAHFAHTLLNDADFSGADVRGVNFGGVSGFTVNQLYSTASYQMGDLSGVSLASDDLTGADFSGQNLTNAIFSGATLTSANFEGADVLAASFGNTTARGFTAAQFYSTSTYQAGDLSGIDLSLNNLSGWNFVAKNLI